MFIPNPDNNNLFVFDNVANFGDAVERFARGANVFWRSGTTYDMLTRYENGKLVGAKYTVDENGASETPGGGGGGLLVHIESADGQTYSLDKTFGEIKNALLSGGSVMLAAIGEGYASIVPIKSLNDLQSGKTIVAESNGQDMTFVATSDNDYPETEK